ncbi:MAG: hypothetical protein AAGF66_03345 [Cyanobacteria bacterium P01_H01_bin.119]
MAFYDTASGDFSEFSISFTHNPLSDFGIFAKGYRTAARTTTTQIINQLQKDRRFSDYLAYPVVFLYRHSFELYLKNIIYWAILLVNLRGTEVEEKLQNTHDLTSLADKAKNFFFRAFPEENGFRDIFDNITITAKEFSNIDPNSYSYRYPVDTTGNHSTNQKQSISLAAFANHMENILEELDTISFGLNVECSIANEDRQYIAEELQEIS